MLAFSQGSADAFGQLFSRYKQPLFGFFKRRVSDPDQADELTQETLVAAFGASARYEPRALFRTYLYAIAFRILSAWRRKAAFRRTFLGVLRSRVTDRSSRIGAHLRQQRHWRLLHRVRPPFCRHILRESGYPCGD